MNISKFTRIIDLVHRLLRCKLTYKSLRFTGGFVYNYIALCEYYGIEWTLYSSWEFIQKEKGITTINSINIYISALEEYDGFISCLRTMCDSEVTTINFFQKYVIIQWANIVCTGYDDFQIIVSSKCIPSCSVENIGWEGNVCHILEDTFQFNTEMEMRSNKMLNLLDPCVKNYIYRTFVLQDVFTKTTTLYTHSFNPSHAEALLRAHHMNTYDNFSVRIDHTDFEILIRVPSHGPHEYEECSICKESMECGGESFQSRTIINLKCSNLARHSFHLNCITKWFTRTDDRCPMCRKEISNQSFFVSYSGTSFFC